MKKIFHKLPGIFPLMFEEEINELVENIKKNRLLESIILHEQKILDGKNRYLACKKAGIKPIFQHLKEGIDLFDFVIAENLKRIQLSSAQKAEIGLLLLTNEKEFAKKRQKFSQFITNISKFYV